MPQDTPTEPSPAPHSDPGLIDLLARLFADVERLIVQELALVRVETAENLGQLIGSIALLLAGLLVIGCGGGAVIAAIVLVLGMLLPMWLAAALVGLLAVGAGAALVIFARRRLARMAVLPHRTLQSLRAARDWAEDELA